MGRLNTIVEKLNKEMQAGATKQQLIQTSKMLLLELEGMPNDLIPDNMSKSAIAVNIVNPLMSNEEKNQIKRINIDETAKEKGTTIQSKDSSGKDSEIANEKTPETNLSKSPSYDELEKEFSVLKVDEEEIAAELEELGNEAISKKANQLRVSDNLLFDPIADIPTLTHQTQQKEYSASELNEKMRSDNSKPSLNDHLKLDKKELSSSLSNEPIKDLKKGIGLNDSYLFINELFRGDETMYTRSIKTINGFSNFAEAQFWIERELKLKLGWVNGDNVVKHFDQLIRRRFS